MPARDPREVSRARRTARAIAQRRAALPKRLAGPVRAAQGRPTERTRRRRIYRRSPWYDMPLELRRRRSFQREWLAAYSDRPDPDAASQIQDTLFSYAKEENTEQAWSAFREVYNDWFMS